MAETQPQNEQLNESLGELVHSLNSQINQLQLWLKCRHISFELLSFDISCHFYISLF